MKNKYPHIFEPMTIRRMTVKNRIVMTPMGTNYGEQNGEMSFLHINYYEQRAKGGTGLLIVENASVDSPQGSNGTTQLRIDLDNYIPRLFKLCENVHKHGACIAIQLNHAGASAMSSRIGMQPVSASDVPSKAGGEIPRPLEKDEIMHIVKKYGEAAKRAQICGFDAVEIHAGHSYLISQFLSPTTNKRTDEFGGSAENRARFAKLVIEEVRKQVGPFFPIFVRISADELMEGGNTLEDTLEYLQYFEKEVDVFDVSCGLNGSIQYQIDANYLPDGWRSYMAKAVKEKYGKSFDFSSLYKYVKFHQEFPQILDSLRPKSGRPLSWTHYRILLQETSPEARAWYAKEAQEQAWSVRTLQRNISSQYYYRMLMSQNTEPVEKEMKELTATYQADKLEFIKNPVIAEFLGLSSNTDFTESELEQRIITHIQKFLMELGKGYAFVARQQHIRTEKEEDKENKDL